VEEKSPLNGVGRCEHAFMDRNKFAKQLELGGAERETSGSVRIRSHTIQWE
jgi:hypothetical protein